MRHSFDVLDLLALSTPPSNIAESAEITNGNRARYV